jgi:hypothetical protein
VRKVFISHSHKDRIFADQLSKDLSKNGLEVWYSEWEMKPGDSLTRKISEGIISSGSMLVLLSSSSVSSKWVEKEFSIALCDNLASRSVKIIPILLEDCTFPRSFHFLGDTVYADFRGEYDVALRRLLAVLGVRPSRQGVKSYTGDPRALKALQPPGIEVAQWEGLRMHWTHDHLAETIEFLLTENDVISRPILEIPLTKMEASKLRRMSEPLAWGYYDLVDPQGPYRAIVQLSFVTQVPEYVSLRWLLNSRRRRALRVSWLRFVSEPTFDELE